MGSQSPQFEFDKPTVKPALGQNPSRVRVRKSFAELNVSGQQLIDVIEEFRSTEDAATWKEIADQAVRASKPKVTDAKTTARRLKQAAKKRYSARQQEGCRVVGVRGALVVVAGSIMLHGVSVTPLMQRYSKLIGERRAR